MKWIYPWVMLFCLFPGLLQAQQNEFNWRLGLYAGIMGYQGDLSYKFIDPNDQLIDLFDNLDYLSYGASLEKRLSNTVSLGAMYTQGQFVANDRTIDWNGDLRMDNPNFLRSLNVRTEIKDLSLYLTLHLDNGKLIGSRSVVAPYLKFSGGFVFFDTFGDLFYGPDNKRRYYYWDDFTVRDRPPGNENAQIIEQDGDFETALQPLETEGVDYDKRAFSLGSAFGLKFRLGSRVNLNLELLARMVTTDYLDDTGENFPDSYNSELQRYAANPANIDRTKRSDDNALTDIYTFTSLSLHYNFGRKQRAFTVPAIAVGPLMTSTPEQERTPTNLWKAADPVVTPDTILVTSVDSTALFANDSLRMRADSLQYLVDSLRERVRILNMPADSLLADSLRRVADSLYMRADSLYPLIDTLQTVDSLYVDSVTAMSDEVIQLEGDTVVMITEDSLGRSTPDTLLLAAEDSLAQNAPDTMITANNDSLVRGAADTVFLAATDTVAQQRIEQLESELRRVSDSLLVTRTQLSAAQAYEPVPDTISPSRQVIVYENEMEDLREEVEVQRSAGNLTPEEEARIAALEDQIEAYDGTLRRMENAVNNDDEYNELKREIEQLRKQLNITTGVGAAAGLTAVVAGGGRNRRDRKAQEEMQAEMAAMQGRIDSLNGVINRLTALDTLSVDSTRLRAAAMPADSLPANPDSLMVVDNLNTTNDSLRLLINRQRLQTLILMAQRDSAQNARDSLRAALEAARRRPGVQRRQSVYFTVNSSSLSPPARQSLDNIADFLKENSGLRIQLEGYTDPSGNVQYNQALSARRTQSVRDYLLQQGVAAGRIITAPQGVDRNVSDPELGRRVDLILREDRK